MNICLDIRNPEQAAMAPHPGAFLIDNLRMLKLDYILSLQKSLEGCKKITLVATTREKACEFRNLLMGWGFLDVECAIAHPGALEMLAGPRH